MPQQMARTQGNGSARTRVTSRADTHDGGREWTKLPTAAVGLCLLLLCFTTQVLGQTELYSTPLYTDPSLIAYYRMEGNANDSSPTDTQGLYDGSAVPFLPACGNFGQGACFNGSATITIPDAAGLDPTTALTVTMWIYPMGSPQYSEKALVKSNAGDPGGYQQWAIYTNPNAASNGVIYGQVSTDSNEASGGGVALTNVTRASILNSWTLLTLTYDGSNIVMYVNGVFAGSTPARGSIVPAYGGSPGNLNIGSELSYGTTFFNGYIDDVAIFSRALSSSEVSNLYSGNWSDNTGTIQVITNLQTATFRVSGPASLSGGGTAATFTNSPAGQYTITFDPVSGHITPAQQTETLTAGGAITFNGTYIASRTMTLNSISGWKAGASVENSQWQGQPNSDPHGPSSSKYYLYYTIDACQQAGQCPGESGNSVLDPYWVLNGSGFCPSSGCNGLKGSLTLSDRSLNSVAASAIKSWSAAKIVFTPSFASSTMFQYTDNPNVSITITAPDGATLISPLPCPEGLSSCSQWTGGVLASIASRGYGQCTWYVANQRLGQHLPIPIPAYQNTAAITAPNTTCGGQCYVPQQWDVVNFGTQHTAIIISPVTTTTKPGSDGSTIITYNFTIGEMNVGTCPIGGGSCTATPWSEQPSTTPGPPYGVFTVLISSTGAQSVRQGILSFFSKKHPATAFFR